MNEQNRTINTTPENEQITISTDLSSMTLARWLLRVLQGALIGVSAILPGISGGVLCVIFGVYQPIMELLAHPFRTFTTHIRLLLPILIGGLIGFLGLARAVEWMFQASLNLAVWLFIGLIAGMIPSLFKEAGKKGRPKSAWISLTVSTVVIFAILFLIQKETSINIQPNIWWYFVCGLLWGISLVMPGMSSSSLLIFLGLYQPMAAGIADLSLQVILPLLAGAFLMIFVSARMIHYLFNKHYAVAFHMILGFVIASTFVIIPLEYNRIVDALLCIGLFAVGFLIAWFMDRVGQKFKPNTF